MDQRAGTPPAVLHTGGGDEIRRHTGNAPEARRLNTRRLSAAVATAAAVGAGAYAGAAPATAASGLTWYCQSYLYSGQSCDGAWHHLNWNESYGSYGSRSECVDEFNGSGLGWTGYVCQRGGTTPAAEYDWQQWGYPRTWGAGQYVSAFETY